MVLKFMVANGNGKRWTYNKTALKDNIENNKYVRNVRQKLVEEKLKKKLQK